MAFQFPFSNLHELNLDWILSKVKTLVDNNEEFNDKADYAVQTADEAKTIAEQAAQASIPDGAVTTIKIADGAVTGNKIAQATIQTGNLSAGCVTTPYILDGAVTMNKLDPSVRVVYSSDVATSNYTLAKNSLVKYGRVASIFLEFTFTENISAYSTIATFPDAFKPAGQYLFDCEKRTFDITAGGGALRIWDSVTASASSPKSVNVCVTYVTAS